MRSCVTNKIQYVLKLSLILLLCHTTQHWNSFFLFKCKCDIGLCPEYRKKMQFDGKEKCHEL